jgi:hypothetical protein
VGRKFDQAESASVIFAASAQPTGRGALVIHWHIDVAPR